MERITDRLPDGTAYVKSETGTEGVGAFTTQRRTPEMIARLCEYEDTGLTPAQVFALKKDHSRALSLAKDAYKLLMAKAADCLLELPCPIGTPVYVHDTICAGFAGKMTDCYYGQDCARNPQYKCPLRVTKRPFTVKMYNGLGTRFWLTEEEAEAAIPPDRRNPKWPKF